MDQDEKTAWAVEQLERIGLESMGDGPEINCLFCEGRGEEEVTLYGHKVVLKCEECRGTGQAIDLIGEGLPDLPSFVKSTKGY